MSAPQNSHQLIGSSYQANSYIARSDRQWMLSTDHVLREHLDKLLLILSLTDDERDFCRSIAGGGGEVTWLMYADWLEERGRSRDAEVARKKGGH